MRAILLASVAVFLITACHHPSDQTVDRDFQHVFGIALPQHKKIQLSYRTLSDSHGDYGLYAVVSLSQEDYKHLNQAFVALKIFDSKKYIEVISYPEVVPYFRRSAIAYERSITSCFGRCAFLPESNQIAFTIDYY